MKKSLVVVISLMIISGCASYRTDSGIDLNSIEVQNAVKEIEILESSLPNGSYQSLGEVEAMVKKLTAFHKSPTKEQVNIALAEEVRKLGGNAAINVKYKSGVGFDTWGYLEAKGEAVKKN